MIFHGTDTVAELPHRDELLAALDDADIATALADCCAAWASCWSPAISSCSSPVRRE